MAILVPLVPFPLDFSAKLVETNKRDIPHPNVEPAIDPAPLPRQVAQASSQEAPRTLADGTRSDGVSA